MNQLRTPDLFRYKQNLSIHRSKVNDIMNRSNVSLKSSLSQSNIYKKSKQTHQRALSFRKKQSSRQIDLINSKLVDRLQQYDSRRRKIFNKEISKIPVGITKVSQNLKRISSLTSSSRITLLKKDNSDLKKKLQQVKSTISVKSFRSQYDKHAERSSSLSKFKIDARSFKFIPKNQILLERIPKIQPSQSRKSLSALKTSNCKINTLTPLKNNSIINKKLLPETVSPFRNVKLSQIKNIQNPQLSKIKNQFSHRQKINKFA